MHLTTYTARLLTCVSRPSNTTPNQVVDDFAVAQSTPSPEFITGIEGDKVRAPRPPRTAEFPDTLGYSAVLCAFPATPQAASPARISLCPSWFVQEGKFSARYEKFNITVPIPKIFHHQSFEAEEVAKELTKKIKAEEDAKEMAKKSAASKRATVAPTKKKTHQKSAKETKPTEQTTAPAPAKEDAPVTTPVSSDSDPAPQKR